MRPSIVGTRFMVIATTVAAVSAVLAPVTTASAVTASYSASYVTLGNGKTVLQRWNPCQLITYKVNLAAVPTASRTVILAETHAAIRVLAAKTGFVSVYRGATTEVPRVGSSAKQSAELIIAYTTPARTNYNLAGSTAAQGGTSASSWSYSNGTTTTYASAITRGFVVVDTPDLLRFFKPGFGTGVRRGNLLLHELAHTAGLKHVSNIHLLLNPAVTAASPNGYAAGDAAGLLAVGRRGGCITIPSFVAADFK
jgi:hypothetical protein